MLTAQLPQQRCLSEQNHCILVDHTMATDSGPRTPSLPPCDRDRHWVILCGSVSQIMSGCLNLTSSTQRLSFPFLFFLEYDQLAQGPHSNPKRAPTKHQGNCFPHSGSQSCRVGICDMNVQRPNSGQPFLPQASSSNLRRQRESCTTSPSCAALED